MQVGILNITEALTCNHNDIQTFKHVLMVAKGISKDTLEPVTLD